MKYFSTRGSEQVLSFEQAVLTGLAPNGGLYIPTNIPSLPSNWETEWANYSFTELSHAILSLYISPDEISPADLKQLIEKSYSTFRHPEVTPTKRIVRENGGKEEEIFVLELWHGPTFAFKDVALQFLGNLFEFFLKRKNAALAEGGRQVKEEEKHKLTVVGATSGDTGSAAIYGLRGKENVSIFILYPLGRVSPIQEAQMTTVPDANVHTVAVKGTFDDCQDIVKALFSDHEFNAHHKLGAVNSINWARILAQIVYYFSAYFSVKRQATTPALQFVVPTGNFGDVLAGYYAKRMGVPMSHLGIGTNENDILSRFWKTGRYEKVASNVMVEDDSEEAVGAMAPVGGSTDGSQAGPGVKATLSPAMDILVSSNFERLLWYLAYESESGEGEARRKAACATVDGWMSKVKSDGRVVLPTSVLEVARRDFVAERISDEQTLDTIRKYFTSKSTPYVVDPHTAVGLAAAEAIASTPSVSPSTSPTQIVLSTAHPAKFSEAVNEALANSPGFDFESQVLPVEFKGLLEKQKRVIEVPRPEIELVKGVIEKVARKETTTTEVGGDASL
ncbi:hypothetical protein M407DRAFT_244563 [Tulasnella calospora MUT 4182]|uniref:threonine synthase n=1 Tax=Tulasnella calospora MUT 4182 TaxID=1051891 RepID=A0A0C3Q4W8_9AGAM|nr:hypothetical protein M407DRAFT_244563 [Tulasnella calospora MUT 4182]